WRSSLSARFDVNIALSSVAISERSLLRSVTLPSATIRRATSEIFSASARRTGWSCLRWARRTSSGRGLLTSGAGAVRGSGAAAGASATLGDDVPESGTYHATSQTAIGTSAAPTTTIGQTHALSAHRVDRLEGRIARATARSNRLRSRRVGILS